MLYSRSEIVELVRREAPELHALLIALIWFASRGDPNLISSERYGLLQVDFNQARASGFRGQANELLEPATNIKVGARVLTDLGLIQFCGRAFATQIPAILRLEQFLSENSDKTGEVESDAVNEIKR